MTPRLRVDYLLLNQPIGQVLRTIQKSAYTRLPLCDGGIDRVIGMVHMKDLFAHLHLSPGKLRFSDQKTPDGQPIAIADGNPGSAVHVIGPATSTLEKSNGMCFSCQSCCPSPGCCGNSRPGRFTWLSSSTSTGRPWAS